MNIYMVITFYFRLLYYLTYYYIYIFMYGVYSCMRCVLY